MVLDRARAGEDIGAPCLDARTRHGGTRADRTGVWRAGDRHRNWDFVLDPSCAVDMGTCGRRCARYRHARKDCSRTIRKRRTSRLALVAVAGVTTLDVVCGASLARRSPARHSSPNASRRLPAIDYHRRTGFPKRLSRCGERHETSRFPGTCAPPRPCDLSLLIEHLPTSLTIESIARVPKRCSKLAGSFASRRMRTPCGWWHVCRPIGGRSAKLAIRSWSVRANDGAGSSHVRPRGHGQIFRND